MNNLRKVNKILFLTLLVFSIGVLGNYSETASKYWIADDSDNILNKTNFKGLTQEIAPNMKIIGDKAQVTVEFYRTAAIGDSKVVKDEIDFSLIGNSSSCKIISISTSKDGTDKGFYKNESNTFSPKPKEGNYQNNVKFTYNDVTSNASDNTSVMLTIECNADDIVVTEGDKKDHLQIEYLATETISTPKDVQTGEESFNTEVFKMFGGAYYSEEKYEKIPPQSYIISDDKKKLTLISTELTEAIYNEWLESYIDKYYSNLDRNTVLARVRAYLNTIYTSPDSIDGLNVNASKTEYSFDDVIVSYAYTNYFKNNEPVALYFMDSTIDNPTYDTNSSIVLNKDTIDNMFKYYYGLYYKNDPIDEEDDKKIQDYVTDNGGMGSVVLNNKLIAGISPDQPRSFVINKSVIRSMLNPVTPDITIDFDEYQGMNRLNLWSMIASSVEAYVDAIYNIKDFDVNMITKNTSFTKFVNDAEGKTTVDKYYYLVIGQQVLSMRLYYNGTDYILHLGAFDKDNLVNKSDIHLLSSYEKVYKTSTNNNDYANIRNAYISFVEGINKTYGTNFESSKTDDIDAVINAVISEISGGQNAYNKVMNLTNTLVPDAEIVIRAQATSTATYGTFTVEFIPPTSGQSNEVSGNEVTPSTTTQEDLAEAAIVGGLSGVASKDNSSSNEARN